ncbi:MAG: pilus assembly protein N-terminal domain-containing protein [Alphaproteobacteria bacterium]|nr:pilus assembly protein N-terminal domain-containing protein [Alphaproteobacteria bacterium]
MSKVFKFKDSQKNLRLALCLGALSVFPFQNFANAESNSVVDILPAASQENYMAPDNEDVTHPPLRLTPDKSELIRLENAAGSVILGNPEHVSVLAESPTILVVVPKMPGATYFTILDNDGEILMQRHVIVASPKEGYVRIRKTCTGSESEANDSCTETDVYYCPDMCHNIAPSVDGDKKGGARKNKDSSSSNASSSTAEGE